MTASLQELRPIHGKPLKKNRWPGIIFVIVFHVFAIYALASGLANSTIQLLKGNLQTVVAVEDVKNDLPPPPPPPDFKPPDVVAIAPDVSIDLAAAPPPPPPAPTPAVATTSHQVIADDYPAISIRLQEQGTVSVKFTINPDGSVTECAVATSSGKPRLDDAACTMVKKRWKYKPATQDGKPVAQTVPQTNVVFQLK